MKTFTAKLSLDGLELGLIVTALDENHSRFKLERSTGEKDPVILTRSGKRSWRVDNPGKWDISESAFKKIRQGDRYPPAKNSRDESPAGWMPPA
jgi:hypothetical protein